MKRAYFELHIAIFLFGFTAILGKLITLDAVPLVWWRVLITSLSLLFFFGIRRSIRTLSPRLILKYLGTGCLLAIHWITFYMAIKWANASIALVAFATQPFFTALIEPIVVGGNVRKYELAIGFLIIPAMFLIVNEVDFSMRAGLWIGIFSAFAYAIFSSFTKKLITTSAPVEITFYQLFGSWLFITLLLPFVVDFQNDQFALVGSDLMYIFILALICTTLPYVLAMRALRYISAFASNLALNLEPVYGIIIAIFLFNENKELTSGFYFGSAIIVATIFSYPFIRRHFNKKEQHERLES